MRLLIKELEMDNIKNVNQLEEKNGRPSLTRVFSYVERYSEFYNVSKIYMLVDFLWSVLFYGCSSMDYFLYKWFLLNRRGRSAFVTERYENKFIRNHTSGKLAGIIDNKEETLHYFSDFIQRDWCGQRYHNTESDFLKFANAHEKAIVKPPEGFGGVGVHIIDTCRDNPGWLFQYCKDNHLMVEALIEQNEKLNLLNPSSVNTIRVLVLDGEIIGATVRIGAGKAIVDNAHSGGFFAAIDIQSGIVISQAMNYRDEHYFARPDTGVVIPGFRIPFWDDCKDFVILASKTMTELKLLGFDIAITPNGPTLVEVNSKPCLRLIQAPLGRGIKQFFK